MKKSLEEATRLEQGILVPVKDLKAAHATLASAFTALAASPGLGCLTVDTAPPLKTANSVILS